MEELCRCAWTGSDPLYIDYHDNEWGRPVHDDRKLFEMLILEGMQAGLSWITILKKREAFRAAFDNFDPARVALYGEETLSSLMENRGIVRNRRKLAAAVDNARAFLAVQRQYGSFDAFIWRYVDGVPIIGSPASEADLPASTLLSERISRDLKRLGFRFVGPTIVYSFMQAVGMVDDHVARCFRHRNNRPAGTD